MKMFFGGEDVRVVEMFEDGEHDRVEDCTNLRRLRDLRVVLDPESSVKIGEDLRRCGSCSNVVRSFQDGGDVWEIFRSSWFVVVVVVVVRSCEDMAV